MPEGPISVRWNLDELPSSQHRAGLGGLALCVGYLQRTPDRAGVCEIEALDPGGLTLQVDRAGMQRLFDDIYAASREAHARGKPLRHAGSRGELPARRRAEGETGTIDVYDRTVPRGGLIEQWDAAPAGAPRLWLKLWRDMIWTILRGVPATREPYDRRAHARPASDGAEAWDALAHRPLDSVALSSTYYLGAQATTAENVAFRDVARNWVLLHFWPFVVAIYVPAVVDREGRRGFAGYALAIPEIVDLEGFVSDWPAVARGRGTEPMGYRPRDAVVDLAAEASLDLARRALAVADRRAGSAARSPWLDAVDTYHVEKAGNSVRIRSMRRVDLHRGCIEAYARVRNAYGSATFRRQRIRNLLEGCAWWGGFGGMCAITTEARTIKDAKFRRDCRTAFAEVDLDDDDAAIYQTIRTYVAGRLTSKYDLSWNPALAANPAWRSNYEHKRERIARDAFLAVRSRMGADFIAYVTATICSVPQRLDEQGVLAIARALHEEQGVERVRSLTLLALCASA
ncbi:MAG TPA: type I-MYXAN CRISPR-associated protein Cmx8 [Kofleriaceae bacterium]|jgi:CRISPR-associated protein Cmx8|nr:type I-MYXAN CRISPR-associated protein Cmx8 [Kofleriaceae bacterium]